MNAIILTNFLICLPFVFSLSNNPCNDLTNETDLEQIVECYIFTQKRLELMKEKLQNLDTKQWFKISQIKNLSEDFIREFEGLVNWEMISYYQNLSDNFMRDFKNKIDWYWIIELGKSIPKGLKKELNEYFFNNHAFPYPYLTGRFE